ncbi:MAG TPA: hypothetical protein VH277_16460 [Gemmatimonadaceae bacterium]|jgi:hypothetical protein|nr:hypothetical protein [Gemmatimonadaceae bacterium]
MASDSSMGAQGAQSAPEMHGLDPVLNAIEQLDRELAGYQIPKGSPIDVERMRLRAVLKAVEQILSAQCLDRKSDGLDTYYAWRLEGIG